MPEVGPDAVHDETPTLVVTTEPHVVVVQLFPLVAVTAVQLATKLAAGLFTVHKVAV